MQYIMRYAHNNSDTAGDLTLDATTDAQAIAEVKDFVRSGYRNETWANVGLSNGDSFICRNAHGRAVSNTTGRPAELTDAKRRNIYIADADMERLQALGDGNASKGLRVALDRAK